MKIKKYQNPGGNLPRRRLINFTPEQEAKFEKRTKSYLTASNNSTQVSRGRKQNQHLKQRSKEGAAKTAAQAKNHPVLNTVGLGLSAIPFVVAAAPAVVGGGELAATALANPYVDAALTSMGGTHAAQSLANGEANWMTALELTPLGRLARPMWNAGKEAVYNIADRYIFMPHQNSFTRGIGMTDAGLQDAVTTGVFRGNPRGTEQTAKVFDKMFLKNRNHFRDIVKDTEIPGIESRYQSRTLTKEDFDALKKSSEKYESLESGNTVGKITLRQSIDPLENYATYEDYIKAVASDIAKTEQMPSRIASGEIVPNTELSEPMWFEDESGRMLLPQGKPFLERFGPNSDYLADGTPLSYWYADGRNPITQGHAYAKSNYGVRVNNPEDYQPFMHELHLHPSFFRSPKFSDPNVEIFGKGPLGLTVKLDKETLQPVWKRDLSNMFRRGETIRTPQITAENAASMTPEQWTSAQDAAIARGDMVEAQRLRDLHFKVSAPEANVSDQFHGTHYDDLGNQILLNKGSEQGTNGIGFYTSSSEPYARRYGPNVFGFKVNAKTEDLAQGRFAYLSENKMNELKAQGYKGTIDATSGPMLGAGRDATEYTFFNPNSYKLADAVTYDNNGVRIPLGERDNFKLNDIRYGLLPFSGLGTASALYKKKQGGKITINNEQI